MARFLSRLLNRNPTAKWMETVVWPEVDVALLRVMGYPFRTRGEVFQTLGPAAQWPNAYGGGDLVWPHKGLRLDFEFDQLIGFRLELKLEDDVHHPSDARPFQGRLFRGGSELRLAGGEDEQSILALFGSPHQRDEDDDEVTLRYQFGDVTTTFELTQAQGLFAIEVIGEGKTDDTLRRGY